MAVIEQKKTGLNSSTIWNQLSETELRIDSQDKEMALRVLNNTPMPTTRTEAWKYTRVSKLGKIEFSNQGAQLTSIDKYIIDESGTRLVFINGHLSEEFSSEEFQDELNITLLSQGEELAPSILNLDDEIFHSLNTAFLTDGVQIEIADNANVERTIQIIHILKGESVISNFKTIIKAGKSSQANIIQGFFAEGEGKSNFCNSTSEIFVGENAALTVDKVQYENESTFHISTEQVQQEKNSVFTINTSTLNGGLVRNNINIDVNGENCVSHMNGVYLLKNKQHVDNHTVMNHKVAHCDYHELYKGVIDDKATDVFNGKVYVRPDAQKINAFQSNGNVLLSDDASVYSKPELEIYADDVKCSHGSTTGQLDEEAIFYLQARGLSKKSAHKLMVSAFIGEALDMTKNENARAFIDNLLLERFGWDF